MSSARPLAVLSTGIGHRDSLNTQKRLTSRKISSTSSKIDLQVQKKCTQV